MTKPTRFPSWKKPKESGVDRSIQLISKSSSGYFSEKAFLNKTFTSAKFALLS